MLELFLELRLGMRPVIILLLLEIIMLMELLVVVLLLPYPSSSLSSLSIEAG